MSDFVTINVDLEFKGSRPEGYTQRILDALSALSGCRWTKGFSFEAEDTNMWGDTRRMAADIREAVQTAAGAPCSVMVQFFVQELAGVYEFPADGPVENDGE